MKHREWKYLRHQYMKRKGYFKIRYTSYTIPMPKPAKWSTEPMGNFAMMIPLEPYKPYIPVKPYRTLSEIRFNLPLQY